MFQNLLLLMSPESAVVSTPGQATPHKPPAAASPAPVTTSGRFRALRFAASVAGNAIGFAGILAACWSGLLLLQSWM